MGLLIFGLLVFLLPGAWALGRAKHELDKRGRITAQTFIAAFVAYVGHAGITLLASWQSAWLLPVPRSVALLTGGLLAVVGATLYTAGRLRFGSFRLTWGLDTSRLVTTGIYRFSRNPQTVGSLLFLTGAGLVGRSGIALLLATVPALASLIWLPIEEGILERRFGDEYRRYRDRTPRYLGLPSDGARDDSVAT